MLTFPVSDVMYTVLVHIIILRFDWGIVLLEEWVHNLDGWVSSHSDSLGTESGVLIQDFWQGAGSAYICVAY